MSSAATLLMDVLRRGQVITNTISSRVIQGVPLSLLEHGMYVLDKTNNLIVLLVGRDSERTEPRARLQWSVKICDNGDIPGPTSRKVHQKIQAITVRGWEK